MKNPNVCGCLPQGFLWGWAAPWWKQTTKALQGFPLMNGTFLLPFITLCASVRRSRNTLEGKHTILIEKRSNKFNEVETEPMLFEILHWARHRAKHSVPYNLCKTQLRKPLFTVRFDKQGNWGIERLGNWLAQGPMTRKWQNQGVNRGGWPQSLGSQPRGSLPIVKVLKVQSTKAQSVAFEPDLWLISRIIFRLAHSEI